MPTKLLTAVFAALTALALAGTASAAVISPKAVKLAVAFWQPYSPTPVCPAGITLHRVGPYGTPGSVPSAAYIVRTNGELVPNCNVYVSPEFPDEPRPLQCAFVARALGVAWFGLSPSRDRRNVMYRDGWVIPRACR